MFWHAGIRLEQVGKRKGEDAVTRQTCRQSENEYPCVQVWPVAWDAVTLKVTGRNIAEK